VNTTPTLLDIQEEFHRNYDELRRRIEQLRAAALDEIAFDIDPQMLGDLQAPVAQPTLARKVGAICA
jgi:hypothetical protein